MTILSPEHLFDQADKLIAAPIAGRPRQVDLRRAISSAYYGLFHATLTAAADNFVGRAQRSTLEYGLVYRSVDHKSLRDLCLEVQKATLPAKYRGYEPAGGFGPDIRVFAAGMIELQDARHAADYDPMLRFKTADARLAISTGRSALTRFARASARRRGRFLSLLLFSPR